MIKAYCKRVLLFIPFLVAYLLSLGLCMLACIVFASEFLFETTKTAFYQLRVMFLMMNHTPVWD